MDGLSLHLLLFAVGTLAGILNILAGGGSFLTLPMLIFLGLPPTVANATNRVGILFQNVGALWRFNRHDLIEWKSLLWAAAPACLGSIPGVWLVLNVSDETFKNFLALMMVSLTLWTLLSPDRTKTDRRDNPRRGPELYAAFFLIGIYGGFVQAGVGFFVLAATTWAGLDLVRGNAVKILSILCFTLLSLALFLAGGEVAWVPGLVLAAGTTLGGQIGTHLTILKGHGWVKTVVTIAVILFALKLWLDS